MIKYAAFWIRALACVSLAAAFVGPTRAAARLTNRIVLVRIDDRPATTQFTEMIGRIGDTEVVMPPRQMLGVFTTGGDPEGIIEWLRRLDYSNVDAVILSTDMLAYGGLMTSRTPATPLDTAHRRLDVLKALRQEHPQLPLYAFNVVQRVALSASAANRSYRDQLARWAVLADHVEKTADVKLKAEYEKLQGELPAAVIQDYLAARARNLQINYAMLDMVKQGVVNQLLLLQDDAHPYGLHRQDQAKLRERIRALNLSDEQAKLYDGADEGASVLLSQAILRKYQFTPRVHVIYSSEAGRKAIGTYEDHPIETSVERQISGSGARITIDEPAADYLLYVNAPEQRDEDFQRFLARLIADVKSGKRVAIADVLFQHHWGGSDQRLIEALGRERLLNRVIGYASWNTPGNTLGTVVPQANLYVLARRSLFNDKRRASRIEAAQIAFLLHRYIGDYGYHTIVRPQVNKYVREHLKLEVDEFEQPTYERVNRMVEELMMAVASEIFNQHFEGQPHFISGNKNAIHGIVAQRMDGLQVRLPWRRSFEVWVDYTLKFRQFGIREPFHAR